MTLGSQMSNFDRVNQYGSKIHHATMTGVTCDTACHQLSQCPPFGPSPQRPCKRRKNMYIHVRVRLEKSLEKVKKRLKKYSQKILQVVQVKKKEKKNFGTSLEDKGQKGA